MCETAILRTSMPPSSEQQNPAKPPAESAPKNRLTIFPLIGITVLVLIGSGIILFGKSLFIGSSFQSETLASSTTTTNPSSEFSQPQWFSLSSVGSSSVYYFLQNDQPYCSSSNLQLTGADAKTMVVASTTGYAKDKNNVYFYCHLIQGADPNSFMLSLVDDWHYSKDQNHIYYDGSAIMGADQTSFEGTSTTSSEYAKDKNNVYYKGVAMAGVDPATFSLGLTQDGSVFTDYPKDKNHVYYNGSIVPNADPQTFVALGYGLIADIERYGKDKNHVYQRDQVFYEADPNTFSLLSGYAKDKYFVYCDNGPISQADSATFSVILALNDKISGNYAFRYAKDKNSVYSACSVITYVDPKTFTLLFNPAGLFTGYAQDKGGIYFGSGLTPVSSSTSSFVVLTGSFVGTYWNAPNYAKDSNHVYDGDAILSKADPATFVDLKDSKGDTTPYARDKSFVYFAYPWGDPASDPGGVIQGADPNSIVALG